VQTLPLLLARAVAWLIVPLYIVGISALVWLESLVGVRDESPVEGAVITVGFGAFAVVGAVLVAKRAANVIGWILAALALMVGLFPAGDAYAAYVMTTRGQPDALATLGAWIQSWYWLLLLGLMLVYLPLLFPDGRLPSRRWFPVALSGGIGTLGAVVLGMLTDTLTGQEVDYQIDNPIGIEGLNHVEDLPIFGVLGLFLIAGIVGAVSSVFVRFYRSRGVERQQMKWFLYAAALILPIPAVDYLPEPVGGLWFGLVLIALPTAIGLAVLRHRLYDIDLIINRTLVYAALSVSVVGLYVLVVVGLGTVLQARGNLLLSIFAAGLVALVFAPLRERLQRSTNRLMYGERDDPYAVISRLGERLEGTLEQRAVLPTVVETVCEALKLPYAAIALKENGERDGFTVAAAYGTPVDSPVRLPLVYRSEPVGELRLAPRAGEESFSAADRSLLDDLARQAGVAAHAVRLASDLQRARERLVSAREEERRRLRRDLHDGLGPQLSSQTLTIDAVRSLMRRDPDSAETLLLDLKAQAQDAISDIRRLVYELRPPALDDLGLVGALRASAAQYGQNGIAISVDVREHLPPLPAAAEVAVYRIAQEAITNVVRHAKARTCSVFVTIDEDANTLRLEVRDDGRGIGKNRGTGVGLTSMRERAEELGGTFTVDALSEGGTVVRAGLPLVMED
jgi:signal transduction histidine kinase